MWIDDGGMLRVGPRSAGAMPGPACYGRGGTEPTVTDAHLVRGTIRADAFLGGAMTLDVAAAHAAFAPIAARLGTDIQGAAAAAIRLAVANIVRAMQLVSTERGRDPRDYALLPFGGAGPLLAAEIADELGVREILVPPNPGVISALGLLSADFMKAIGVTRRTPLDAAAPGVLQEIFARFQQEATAEFRALGLEGALGFALTADMRFVGQAFEIPVDIDPAELPNLTPAGLAAAFTAAHHRVYFHGGEPGRKVEIVGLRCTIRRRLEALPEFRERPTSLVRPAGVTVRVGAADVTATLRDAAGLAAGETVAGPALIEGYSSSIWVPPGWRAQRDPNGNILMRGAAA